MGAGLDTKACAEDKPCGWSNTFCTRTVPNLHFWRWRDRVRFLYPDILKLNSIEIIVNTGSSLKSSWHILREGLNGFLFFFFFEFQIICLNASKLSGFSLLSLVLNNEGTGYSNRVKWHFLFLRTTEVSQPLFWLNPIV